MRSRRDAALVALDDRPTYFCNVINASIAPTAQRAGQQKFSSVGTVSISRACASLRETTRNSWDLACIVTNTSTVPEVLSVLVRHMHSSARRVLLRVQGELTASCPASCRPAPRPVLTSVVACGADNGQRKIGQTGHDSPLLKMGATEQPKPWLSADIMKQHAHMLESYRCELADAPCTWYRYR